MAGADVQHAAKPLLTAYSTRSPIAPLIETYPRAQGG